MLKCSFDIDFFFICICLPTIIQPQRYKKQKNRSYQINLSNTLLKVPAEKMITNQKRNYLTKYAYILTSRHIYILTIQHHTTVKFREAFNYIAYLMYDLTKVCY